MLHPETEKFYQTLLARTPKGHLSLPQIRFGFEKLMADFPAQPDVHFQLLSIGKLSAAWVHAPYFSMGEDISQDLFILTKT
jgi:hypothetical protein